MEFHAFILCGKGHSLSPFSRVRSTGMAKALLPVANRPMIDYVLEWCEKAFFPRVTIVTSSDTNESIGTAVDLYKERKHQQESRDEEQGTETTGYGVESMQIDLMIVDEEQSGAIINKMYSQKVLGPDQDFVLLPCDFVTDIPPQVLIEEFRNHAETDVGMLVHYKNSLEIEDKKKNIFPSNYTIFTEHSDGQMQLLDIYSEEDIRFHKSLQLRTQMLWRHPNSIVSTKLLNSSIFFGSNKILQIIESQPNKFTESYFQDRSITKVIRDLARRSWRHSAHKETIGCLILPDEGTFFRNNNLAVLMESNRYYMKNQAMSKFHQTTQPKEKGAANVGLDSFVGPSTSIGEKTNVKRSVVGANCTIGKKVRLTGCLVFDNVTIQNETQLENCIIGTGVTIESGSKLTNCNVESTHVVPGGTTSKGDTLLCLSLEGLQEDNEFALDDSVEESDSDVSSGSYDDFSDDGIDNNDGLFGYS